LSSGIDPVADQNRLIVGGKTLLKLPADTWVHLEIAADLGKDNSGKWNLIVKVAGQQPREFKHLANGTAAFDQLTWLGFTSNATSESVFYVDNLSIENH